MTGQLLAVAWEVAAVGFLVLLIRTVRKAKARGKRLFADQPDQRARSLHQDTTHLHETDAFL